MAPVIECEALSKRYQLGQHHGSERNLRETLMSRLSRDEPAAVGEIWSLRDVSLAVEEGEAVGIIGRNGSGKSTLLKILSRITAPTEGRVRTRGRIGSLLEVGTGFHPELTGRENVRLNGAVLGMSRREVNRKFDEIVEFAGIGAYIDTPVKRYSSGMYLRLAFSVAAHLEADILLVDEVLAVGDADFQRRCLGKMSEVERSGRTVIFVSHNLDAVIRLCRRAVWLDGGRVRAAGATDQVVNAYAGEGFQTAGIRAWDPADDRPVQLLGLAVSEPGGAPTNVLDRDAGIHLSFEMDVGQAGAGSDMSVIIATTRGTRIIDAAVSDDGLRLDRPGRYRLHLRVPPLLTAGEYSVTVWVGTPYEDYVWEENALTLRLEGPTHGRSDRLIDLRHAWTLEDAVVDNRAIRSGSTA
jgi:ABC-type polysaccharide/polyol phosphate transport system ATPase subunit